MVDDPKTVELGTAHDLIAGAARSLGEAGLYFGHGTDNPVDEAAALVFKAMSLDHDGAADQYERVATPEQRLLISRLLQQRIDERVPLPYLLGEAWFCGLPFNVDERVLIPRSPIAELITQQFQPWVDPEGIRTILEIGTGSGCIAIACALAFPDAVVTATDISPGALEVAAGNVERHGVGRRVNMVETDVAEGVEGPFDLIVSNPPYVREEEMGELPAEYIHEPSLGLVSGADGLDSARRILQDASRLLCADGVLVLEVGAQWCALDEAFPSLPFTWLDFDFGGTGVALLQANDLRGVGNL